MKKTKEKKQYRVTGHVTISMSTLVEATSPKAAKEIAEGRGMMSLCYQCARGEEKEEWVTSGEFDGQPTKLLAVVEEEHW